MCRLYISLPAGKLGRAESDIGRLSELKHDMTEKVSNLEKNKHDQSDMISRWVRYMVCGIMTSLDRR